MGRAESLLLFSIPVKLSPSNSQAMDRAHRIGQKKVVNVYRMITRATIEEKIMSLQKFKLHTARTVISSDNSDIGSMQVHCLFKTSNSLSTFFPRLKVCWTCSLLTRRHQLLQQTQLATLESKPCWTIFQNFGQNQITRRSMTCKPLSSL